MSKPYHDGLVSFFNTTNYVTMSVRIDYPVTLLVMVARNFE